MKYLIVNADGFGFSEGCNSGIFETIKNSFVTSVSVNMNFPAAEDIVKLQKEHPHVSIGIHLNPVVGVAVSSTDKVMSLLNPETNEFWGGPEFTKRLLLGRIDLGELELELTNQIQKALSMGINITHIDSHQNRHLYPKFFGVFLRVGKKIGIMKMRSNNYYFFAENGKREIQQYYTKYPLRFVANSIYKFNMSRARRFGFKVPDRNLTFNLLKEEAKYLLDNWIFIFRNLPGGYNEVYFHPAYPDDTLKKYASYVSEREMERTVIQEPILKEIIEEEKIKLISFNNL